MKSFRLLSFLVFVTIFALAPQAHAINPADRAPLQEAVSHHQLTKKEQRQQKRLEKRLKKMEKKGVDFSDPVNKWLWYAIFAWGASVVLSILLSILFRATLLGGGGFGLYYLLWVLTGLLGLAGGISFVIWLIKKFG